MSNPTTGEWTAQYVLQHWPPTAWAKEISDAHNAALAAEREKRETAEKLAKILNEQADKEQVETLADLQDAMTQVEQLREQLAAESQLNADIGAVIRDFAVELCGSQFGKTGDEAAYTPMKVRAFLSQLRAQLATAVEALKEAREAMALRNGVGQFDNEIERADAALAKIGAK